jgi:hypothetical protein
VGLLCDGLMAYRGGAQHARSPVGTYEGTDSSLGSPKFWETRNKGLWGDCKQPGPHIGESSCFLQSKL